MRRYRFVFVLLFFIGLFITTNEVYKYYYVPQGAPVIIEKIYTATANSTLPQEEIASATPTDLASLHMAPLIDGYAIEKRVDLSSGVPIQMVVNLPGGKALPSSWALPYSNSTVPDEHFFEADKGTTYIYKTSDFAEGFGSVSVLLAHSASVGGKDLFAANLEYFLRIKEIGVSTYTVPETLSLFNSQIVGSKVTICQDEGKKPLFPASMDVTCQGSEVRLQIVGGEIIWHEDIWEFEQHVNDLHHWLVQKYPYSGFDDITDKDGFLYVFCLGRLADQENDGSDRFSYNRVVLALKVIP